MRFQQRRARDTVAVDTSSPLLDDSQASFVSAAEIAGPLEFPCAITLGGLKLAVVVPLVTALGLAISGFPHAALLIRSYGCVTSRHKLSVSSMVIDDTKRNMFTIRQELCDTDWSLKCHLCHEIT